ncbi:response regulator [Algicola sagamiensis]|uniref:response regulator n=1 Tax=Algicola sagamiensis TaxID=163869 RepID=UPI0003636B51|nr:response regulator [Algicola sagamiensis]
MKKENLKDIFYEFPNITLIVWVVGLSLFPSILNLLGLELSTEDPQGMMIHTLTEWSSVSIAFFILITSLLHYQVKHDPAIPLIGISLFSAGVMDGFHSIASMGMIELLSPQSELMMFTWVLSRIFFAFILMAGCVLAIWYPKFTFIPLPNSVNKDFYFFAAVGAVFMTILGALIVWTLSQKTLPQTIYQDAFIQRPFDILPLAIFVVNGVLLWIWYTQRICISRCLLFLIVAPSIMLQCHIAFGSERLFDSHFHIAHALKVMSYMIALAAILYDIVHQERTIKGEGLREPRMWIEQESAFSTRKNEAALEVGKPKWSLGILIPVMVFVLTLLISLTISFLDYFEAKHHLYQKEIEQLIIESNLSEPHLEQFFLQARNDVVFISRMPAVFGLIRAIDANDTEKETAWREGLERVFTEMLSSKPYYSNLTYVGLGDLQQEIVQVVSRTTGIFKTPPSRYVSNHDDIFIEDTFSMNEGEVNFSPIFENAIRGLRSELHTRVATPVFHPETREVFGAIIAEIRFSEFINTLNQTDLASLKYMLADKHGNLFYAHGNILMEGTPSDEITDLRLEDIYPKLTKTFLEQNASHPFMNLKNLEGEESTSYLHYINMEDYGDFSSLYLLLEHNNTTLHQEIASVRNRSILLGIATSLLALALTILISRRVISPLTTMSDAVRQHHDGETTSQFPTHSQNEIGVLARSFHNLILRMNESIQTQHELAMVAQESSERFQAILDAAVDGIITVDEAGIIQSFNPAAEKMFGYSEIEIKGSSLQTLFSEVSELDSDATQLELLIEGTELCGLRKDGRLFQLSISISEVMTQKGLLYMGLVRDITQTKRVAEELVLAKERAEDAVRSKSEFLACMSHEIRTPMNGVLGMLGLVLNTQLSSDQRHRLSVAQSSAKSLLGLINDILDFSKVDSGKMELEVLEFNLHQMLSDFIEGFGHLAQDKKIELILDVTGVEYAMVQGDPGRLRQIFTNLVSNAIKFTASGEIVVRVTLHTMSEQFWQLEAQVQDSGIGIPEDKRADLFTPFSQVDASTTRKYGGTGLGLAIVKQLCELMSGDIDVQSEIGIGSCFEFNILLEKSEKAGDKRIDFSEYALHVLIVDDNRTNRNMITAQLSQWGVCVESCEDAAEALVLCDERIHAQQPMYDVALLDLKMPGMNGIELAKRLKLIPQLSSMKLVIMTLMHHQEDLQYYASFGFSAYFPKPVTLHDLHRVIKAVTTGEEQTQEQSQGKTGADNHELLDKKSQFSAQTRVLLVEDNQVNQLVASGILEEFGLNADIAANGIEALASLHDAAAEEPYHLVLMDCQMPEMDGYEATRQIRVGEGGNAHQNVTIIAMTANVMQGDQEKCLEAGMNDYIAKPIDKDVLYQKLKQWLNQIELPQIEQSHQPTQEKHLVWDEDAILKRVCGKKELLDTLVLVFFKETPHFVEQLIRAIDADDFEQAYHLAHTIKGSAGNLSGLQLEQIGAKIESAAMDKNAEQLRASRQLLRQTYRAFSEALQQYQQRRKDNPKSESVTQEAISQEAFKEKLTSISNQIALSEYIDPNDIELMLAQVTDQQMRHHLDNLEQSISSFDFDKAQTHIHDCLVLFEEKGEKVLEHE